MGNDGPEEGLAASPRQVFRGAVCIECREYINNNGGCAAGADDILRCIEILKFDDEFVPLSGNTGSVGDPRPGDCKCKE